MDLTFRKLAEIGLRDADRRKDEFLATLSHELRNPLAPIRTAIEVMRLARRRSGRDRRRARHDGAPGAPSGAHHRRLARRRAHHAEQDGSAARAAGCSLGADERRRNHARERRRPGSPAHHRPARASALGRRRCHAARAGRLEPARQCRQVHRTRRAREGVRVRATQARSRIAVEDSGVGIPPAMLARIFDMFTQLQDFRDRTQGGLGIGLTLARRLIELHGGTIEAFSEGIGRGSCFVIHLPLLAAAAGAADEGAGDRPSSQTRRVLVAEDNADAAEMMRVMLGLNGHDVRVAADGAEAVAVAKTFRPHIAFIDIGMPRLDGYEVADRIRRMEGPPIVLVALTGWGQDEDKRRSRDAGFDHHLTKPPEPDVVQRLIAACPDSPASDGPESR